MPKQKRKTQRKTRVNKLANYIATESAREVGPENSATDAQLSLLLADGQSAASSEPQRRESAPPQSRKIASPKTAKRKASHPRSRSKA